MNIDEFTANTFRTALTVLKETDPVQFEKLIKELTTVKTAKSELAQKQSTANREAYNRVCNKLNDLKYQRSVWVNKLGNAEQALKTAKDMLEGINKDIDYYVAQIAKLEDEFNELNPPPPKDFTVRSVFEEYWLQHYIVTNEELNEFKRFDNLVHGRCKTAYVGGDHQNIDQVLDTIYDCRLPGAYDATSFLEDTYVNATGSYPTISMNY